MSLTMADVIADEEGRNQVEEGNGSRRKLDGELRAMQNILGFLEPLDRPAQQRVLLWLSSRLCNAQIAVRAILEDDGHP